ncbi:winged helix-turn-helix domain-containing protein [Trinickia diaoshuihuensis]|uniref:winged helix-turn-helix domain-containing protein n=1 Tax=Trinickia diaoshuihuensis TaxID=2292265 RepID=UPI000E23DCEF|nr:winged helix-turn-helix domain-containing protein [Trinickia diaoshuihuensis]
MYRFDQVTVCLDSREVWVDGDPHRLSTRAFDILELLIHADGGLVTKHDIMRVVWPHTVVGDNNIQVHISALRKLLGGKQGWIKTCAGRGYRLVRPAAEPSPQRSGRIHTFVPATPAWRGQPSLSGREEAIADIRALLAEGAVVTLAGPGGIGKTAVACEISRYAVSDLDVEAYFVDLAAHCPTVSVMQATAWALGAAGPARLEEILRAVGERKVMLIFDSCEHVIGELAVLCLSIRARKPNVAVLATSREPLCIPDERIYRVPALNVPAPDASNAEILMAGAVQMFLRTGEAMGSAFPLDSTTLHRIAALCRRLDGIPLALELAASRAASIGIDAVLSDADDLLLSIRNRLRYVTRRHSTLEASIDWSYQLLDEAERIVLSRLARLDGWFELASACELAACESFDIKAVRDSIAGLVSKSMIMTRGGTASEAWSLLGMVRAFMLRYAARIDAGESLESASAAAEPILAHARSAQPMRSHTNAPAL